MSKDYLASPPAMDENKQKQGPTVRQSTFILFSNPMSNWTNPIVFLFFLSLCVLFLHRSFFSVSQSNPLLSLSLLVPTWACIVLLFALLLFICPYYQWRVSTCSKLFNQVLHSFACLKCLAYSLLVLYFTFNLGFCFISFPGCTSLLSHPLCCYLLVSTFPDMLFWFALFCITGLHTSLLSLSFYTLPSSRSPSRFLFPCEKQSSLHARQFDCGVASPAANKTCTSHFACVAQTMSQIPII